jgi:Flp pilus assembly protein TadD
MSRIASGNRMLGLVVTSALTGVLLSGCASSGAEPASISANRAEGALATGNADKAIRHAEAAVLADPRNATYRSTLGAAYLNAGRFASATTTFRDAMQLGDNSPRTVLSLSLALTGEGKFAGAAALLGEHEGQIAAADVGLAFALAGQPGRGIDLMSNAIRGGENTAKMRQNLAFAYALAGRWREARLMTEQDLAGEQVSDRIEQWAMLAHPDAWQQRVASLLGVPAGVSDAGQPAQLALVNNPSIEQLAAEAAAPADVTVPAVAELPALAAAEAPARPVELAPPTAEPARQETFQAAFAAPAPSLIVPQDASRFAAAPVVRPAPVREVAARAPAANRVAQQADGTHLVQLGSFTSEQGARRAWNIYQSRYPELAGHRMVISEAVVNGKHYWRVSAAGFGRSSAAAMCGRVKSSGQGCFAYTEGRPLPGAVDKGTRLARR